MKKYRCRNCGAPYCTDCEWGDHYDENGEPIKEIIRRMKNE
jgi:hypothetical protein